MKTDPPALLPGVRLLRQKKLEDGRGFFVELYSQVTAREHGITETFVQDNCSLSVQPGTVRGLHYQLPPFAQAKLVRVERGAIFDAFVDLRRASPTFGKAGWLELQAEDWAQLYVPAGFAHGFCTLAGHTVVHYKVSAPYHREAERGIRWDDPQLAVPWPKLADPGTLSDKDSRLPPASEAVAELAGERA